MTFDFTAQGRRPTTAQILSQWKKAGRPQVFEVAYGETYAEFRCEDSWGGKRRWDAFGNGCRGVNRDAVIEALNTAVTPTKEG